MASAITVQIGALTRTKNYANDTKAQATLLSFYLAKSLGPVGATNAQKLDAIIDWWAKHMHYTAVQYDAEQARVAEAAQAETDYGFE